MRLYGDFLGDGLFRELAENFGELFHDRGLISLHELEEVVRQHPTLPRGFRGLGFRLIQDGQYHRASQMFRKALELDASDRQSQMGLICCLEQAGTFQTAIELIEKCLEHAPDYCPALVALGFCRERLGDTSDAIAAYERAMRLSPHLKRIRTRFANLLHTCEVALPTSMPNLQEQFATQLS